MGTMMDLKKVHERVVEMDEMTLVISMGTKMVEMRERKKEFVKDNLKKVILTEMYLVMKKVTKKVVGKDDW
jgi:flagellar biosynthesis GTPase FlhF